MAKKREWVGDGKSVTLQQQLLATVKATVALAKKLDPDNDLAFLVSVDRLRAMLAGVPKKELDEAIFAAEKAGLLRLYEESMHMGRGFQPIYSVGRAPIQFVSLVSSKRSSRRR